MTQDANPFVRGYQNLTIRRQLAISYEDDCPLCYRPLHDSQADLPDAEVQLHPCVFNDDFALITEGQEIADSLLSECNSDGIVRAVVYAIMADDFGTPVHVGDQYSREAAEEVVRRLRFETGFFSRCWEISSLHITEMARDYLEARATAGTPSGLMFEAFRVPGSFAIGVKLIATPWTDANLKPHGTDATRLREEQRVANVPKSLVQVLHLAALADARILIFDPEADVLEGLQLYPE